VRPAVWLAILVTAWLLVNLSSLWIECELRILFRVFTVHEFTKLDPSLLYFDTEELYLVFTCRLFVWQSFSLASCFVQILFCCCFLCWN